MLVPEGDVLGARWGGLPTRGRFALLRLTGGGAHASTREIEALADLPRALRVALPWLRLVPGRTYAFGAGEAGRRALRLAVARPRLLAGVAVSDPFTHGGVLPSGGQLAFAQVPIQVWAGSDEQALRTSGLVRAVRTARAGGRILQARGGWPAELETGLLGFGLLPLASETAVRRPGSAPGCGAAGALSYPWPVRPFLRAHPVRGNVGDPRTRFGLETPTAEVSAGQLAFHDGVDVVAPGGTPVFPVVSGVAEPNGRYGVVVRSAGGRSFVYQHLTVSVRSGARVQAGETILGRILPRSGHVHLAEFAASGAVVNPLRHLTPYRDGTAPTLRDVATPERARGQLELSAAAYDVPELPAGGAWTGLPVAPAEITLTLRSLVGRVVRRSTAVDFVSGIPANAAFRSVYLPGTRQNFSVVGFHYFAGSAGSYRYRLALDVRQVRPASYDLEVRATDTCGNSDEVVRRILILRDPSYRPPAQRRPKATRPGPTPLEGYTVVLASVRGVGAERAAEAAAARARASRLPRVAVLRSDRYRGLTPGYLVVVSGSYASPTEAGAGAVRAARAFPTAYPRLVGKVRGQERPRSGRRFGG